MNREQLQDLYIRADIEAMDFDTFDTDVWAEINDMPGEIYDIEEEKFDVQEYINGNTDY